MGKSHANREGWPLFPFAVPHPTTAPMKPYCVNALFPHPTCHTQFADNVCPPLPCLAELPLLSPNPQCVTAPSLQPAHQPLDCSHTFEQRTMQLNPFPGTKHGHCKRIMVSTPEPGSIQHIRGEYCTSMIRRAVDVGGIAQAWLEQHNMPGRAYNHTAMHGRAYTHTHTNTDHPYSYPNPYGQDRTGMAESVS